MMPPTSNPDLFEAFPGGAPPRTIAGPATAITKRGPLHLPREVARGEPPATLLAAKVLRGLILLAHTVGLVPGFSYSVPAEVLRDLFGCRDDTALRASLQSLRGQTWDWPSAPNADHVAWVSPIPSLRWEKGTDLVEWEFSTMFLRLLSEHPSGFIKIPWERLRAFRSLYALRLYEIITSHEHHETHEGSTHPVGVEILRRKLGVPDEAYRTGPGKNSGNTGSFWDRCVYLALREIKEVTGVKAILRRSGRGATARYWFVIENAAELLAKANQYALPLRSGDPKAVRRHAGTYLTEELAARCGALVTSLPPEQQEKVSAAMFTRGLPAHLPASAHDGQVKGYASALRSLGLEIPPPADAPTRPLR